MAVSGTVHNAGLAAVWSLYRSVVRVHRTMPRDLRDMGEPTARAEFKAHLKGNTTREQWVEFAQQWRGYVALMSGASAKPAGDDDLARRLAAATSHVAENLAHYTTAEQRLRLEALKKETAQKQEP